MKVALVVKASDGTQERENRNMGYWSYPVPEFTWNHLAFPGKEHDGSQMNNGYDIIFQEDAGPYYFRGVEKPLVYLAIDSTLSDDHLESRLIRAEHADLILLDMDKEKRFADIGVPVRRLNYCVNDHLFRDYGLERDIDVSFYCGTNPERGKIRNMLREFCASNDISFETGTLHPVDYAKAMARSKIVVNWPRVPENRPHRVFDAMACGACLLTGPLPDVPGDRRIQHTDYVEVQTIDELTDMIGYLLLTGD